MVKGAVSIEIAWTWTSLDSAVSLQSDGEALGILAEFIHSTIVLPWTEVRIISRVSLVGKCGSIQILVGNLNAWRIGSDGFISFGNLVLSRCWVVVVILPVLATDSHWSHGGSKLV